MPLFDSQCGHLREISNCSQSLFRCKIEGKLEIITSLSPVSYILLFVIGVNMVLAFRFYVAAVDEMRSSNSLVELSVHKSVFYGDAPPIARANYGRVAEMISLSILSLATIFYHEDCTPVAIILAIPGVGMGIWFRYLDYKWRKSKGIS